MTFSQLARQISRTVTALEAAGIGREDRVATVLSNGPEAASAFLAIASTTACAPLNPAYREAEFRFFLSDLAPKAVVIEEGASSPAIAVAESLGIPILRLRACPEGSAGEFDIQHELAASGVAMPAAPGPEDIALVLHTSGTTSRPKQVPLSNANLCHSAAHIQRTLELTAADRCLNVMPLYHIHGLAAAVLASMAAGASVVCTPGFYAPQFLDWLSEFEPTWYTAVPTIHQSILARASGKQPGGRLRFIRSSSAPLAPKVMEDLERVFGVPVIEAYGMTEAAHQMASNPLPPGKRKPGSVGLAAGPEIAIMDEAGKFAPHGATGEIVIRGPNVTPGYVANSEANRSAFSGGWFRTGDLGSLDEDGYLFISGRSKEIINRGGEKISPREIDEVLLRHPAVAQALAFALPDPKLGEEPAAAVVLKPGAAAGEAELREFASRWLADFKVPRAIVLLEDIPKGPTGKPQRIGLAAKLHMDGQRQPPITVRTRIGPRTATEKLVAGLWRQVLGRDDIGLCNNFFDLGGDSMLAAQLLSRIKQSAGKAPPVLRLFEQPTVEALAAWLDTNPAEAAERPLRHDPAAPAVLSFAQQRFWFLDQYENDSAAYINCAAFRLRGPLDVKKLQRALDRIVERHEVLRTTYSAKAGLPAAILNPPRPVELETLTVQSLEAAEKLATSEASRRFDLTHDLMIRSVLARLAPDDHLLMLTRHHIAFDGWSMEVLLRELATLYGGEADSGLPVQYGDYARWQAERYADGAFDNQLAYWKERLVGSPPLLPMPVDRPRPPRQTFHGSRETFLIPREICGALNELARNAGATLFMTLLAGFQTLLHRYSGATDIVVGCPVAGRSRVELEPLIGLFVNTLALRSEFSGDPTFRELLERVRQTSVEAYAHQDLPFEKLVEALQPERSLSHSPLFQVFFQLRNLPFEPPHFAELTCEAFSFDPGTAQFDLEMDIVPADGALQCTFTYNTDLFHRETARKLASHYRNLLAFATTDPGRRISAIPILDEEERTQLLSGWNQTETPLPPCCVHELVAKEAARNPDALAVLDRSGSLTYSELNRAADQLAERVRSAGVGPGVLVAVCAERSRTMVVALLAILKAGGAYLPLDPLYPKERLAFMLEDSGAAVLLTEIGLSDRLPAGMPAAVVLLDEASELSPRQSNRWPDPGPESPTYAIYTSGSTGVPKAALIPHRGLINVLASLRSEFGFGRHDCLLAVTTLSFDIAAAEIFLPLICGGMVAIASGEEQRDGRLLMEAIERVRPTYLQATPATWGMLIDAGWRGGDLTAICTGEAMSRPLADALLDRAGRVFNLYGPTETTIFSTLERVQAGTGAVLIGRPLANTRVYVLDEHLEPVPQGVPGELYIAGTGVALGYWKRPELTVERFPPDRFTQEAGSKMYRTGDRVRWLPDGKLEYLGRRDAQIKLHGFRIEPNEVEAALTAHPDVRAAAVTVSGDSLVAWCVWRDAAVESNALRRFLAERLPHYMVPARFITRTNLPRLPNGKVDRGTLARLVEPPQPGPASEAPGTETERKLARIWEELLAAGPVGVHDDFFDLGGHSLLAARVVARIEETFGRRLPVAALFEAPTVAQLAAHVSGGVCTSWPPRVIPIQPAGARIPFWAVGGAASYRALAEQLGPEQPVMGLLLEDADARNFGPPYQMETIAAEIVRLIRQQQPNGPYQLGGHSMYGLFAFEVARQLVAEGEDVRLLALFDPYLPVPVRLEFPLSLRIRVHLAAAWWLLSRGRLSSALAFLASTTRDLATRAVRRPAQEQPAPESIQDVLRRALAAHRPQPYPGRVVFFEAADQPIALHLGSCLGWAELAGGGLDLRVVPGDHSTLLQQPNAAVLAATLAALLAD